jgi:hypothetical protein
MSDDTEAIRAARAEAEASAKTAQAARQQAERSAGEAEFITTTVERERFTAATYANAAGAARVTAEAARDAAEGARNAAEAARIAAEASAISAGIARDAAEARATAATAAHATAEASATAARAALARVDAAVQALQIPIPHAPAAERERVAARADLIKRLFPVAIGIGVAVPLTQILLGGKCPSSDEWAKIARLCTGMLVVLFSWDWYHRDITDRPPNRMGQFIIDVVVVFSYMLLLFLSGRDPLWSYILALIFLLFVISDLLSVWDHVQEGLKSFWVNFCWLIYFSGLAYVLTLTPDVGGTVVQGQSDSCFSFFVQVLYSQGMWRVLKSCLFVFAGILLIWAEEAIHPLGRAPWIAFCIRIVLIGILIIAYIEVL